VWEIKGSVTTVMHLMAKIEVWVLRWSHKLVRSQPTGE